MYYRIYIYIYTLNLNPHTSISGVLLSTLRGKTFPENAPQTKSVIFCEADATYVNINLNPKT